MRFSRVIGFSVEAGGSGGAGSVAAIAAEERLETLHLAFGAIKGAFGHGTGVRLCAKAIDGSAFAPAIEMTRFCPHSPRLTRERDGVHCFSQLGRMKLECRHGSSPFEGEHRAPESQNRLPSTGQAFPSHNPTTTSPTCRPPSWQPSFVVSSRPPLQSAGVPTEILGCSGPNDAA